jgi:putative ABC transport system ATP-binding protein
MIKIKELHFTYLNGNFNLKIDNFSMSPGEKLAVIGPSGSGKTTLLNLISGILQPNDGEIQINETNVQDLNEIQRRDFRIQTIGFVFQEFELIEYLNVLDNILHPYRITKKLKLTEQVRKRAVMLASNMGIEDKLQRNISNLSQGEKQRVAICRALLPKPVLILADEATGNLDPENKSLILDLLLNTEETKKTTVLAVTHDHELLPKFDRIVDFKQFIS